MISNPQTFNLAQASNFQVNILRAPAVTYFCQEFEIPGVNMTAAKQPTPYVNVPLIGDHLEYDPLTIQFKVDADYQNWLEIFNWMRGITSPTGKTEVYKKLEKNPQYLGYGVYSDLQVIQLDENRNPFMQFKFENAFPIRLSPMKMQTDTDTITYLTATATFKYVEFHQEIL